jgi:hypothetical protein
MNRFSTFCSVMVACASMTSQAAVPEIDLSVKINIGANEFSAEAILKLEASKMYVFKLAPGLDVDSSDVDAVAIPTVKRPCCFLLCAIESVRRTLRRLCVNFGFTISSKRQALLVQRCALKCQRLH